MWITRSKIRTSKMELRTDASLTLYEGLCEMDAEELDGVSLIKEEYAR